MTENRRIRWRKKMLAEGRCPSCGRLRGRERKQQLCEACSEAQKIRMQDRRIPVPDWEARPRHTPALKEEAIEMYREGHTLAEVGMDLGVSTWAVGLWLQKAGVERRPPGARPKNRGEVM